LIIVLASGLYTGERVGVCLTGCLDLATVHGEHDSWTPVQEALRDAFADESDCVAGQSAHVELVVGVGVHGEIFEEDGDALHWLMA